MKKALIASYVALVVVVLFIPQLGKSEPQERVTVRSINAGDHKIILSDGHVVSIRGELFDVEQRLRFRDRMRRFDRPRLHGLRQLNQLQDLRHLRELRHLGRLESLQFDRFDRLDRLNLQRLNRLDRLNFDRLDRFDRLQRLNRLDRLDRLDRLGRFSRFGREWRRDRWFDDEF